MVFLVLLFIVVPIIELFVIIQVGEAIGVLPTIALLVADSILGAMLMRSQGRVAWRRFNAALAEGRIPHREVLDGALVIFGGALLLTPGFITRRPRDHPAAAPDASARRAASSRAACSPRIVISRFGAPAAAAAAAGRAPRRPAPPARRAGPTSRAPRPRSTRPRLP